MEISAINHEICVEIAELTSISEHQVQKTLELLLQEATVPFIARYRKEVTGGLDEVQIRDIRNQYDYIVLLNDRRAAILRSIIEQNKLTPDLEAKIKSCKLKAELEDLYLPFKPKKRTRGQIAVERGLADISDLVFNQEESVNLKELVVSKIGTHADLKDESAVIQGVTDYIAEKISESAEARATLRNWIFEHAVYTAQVKDEFKDVKTKYNNYYQFSEPVKSIVAHRLMALRRAEKEEVLSISLSYDTDTVVSLLNDCVIQSSSSEEVKTFLVSCVFESFQRLLSPSIETEIRLESKNFAEEEAINIFSKNLKNLLLLPPSPKRTVLGVDPGFRTGSKIVVVDKTGKLLETATIFPLHDESFDHPKNKSAAETLLRLIKNLGVSLISIGNGTAGREMEAFVEKLLSDNKDLTVRVVVVNESGASVYSASDIAREEFPDLDITYRGSVSIARRLQDPLAELVKIDPKSIGVGQYQHDVNQNKLKKQLTEVVESCVNYVGVNLNTASPSLLSYVSGIGDSLSKNIVKYRDSHGEFKSRQQLFEVSGFGPRAFEQAAGFLRIPESQNPLDNTAVHPESYNIISKMAEGLSRSVPDLIGNKDFIQKIKLDSFVSEKVGLPTLQDIIKELLKPGRDPREDGSKHSYSKEVRDFNQLVEGQVLTGTVTNVTNFGAFVDIGVHQDGLIHISEISNQFIKDISQAINVGDSIRVKVIGVDKERKRISLSKKACEEVIVSGFHSQDRAPRSETVRSVAGAQARQSSGQTSKQNPARKTQNFLVNEKSASYKRSNQNQLSDSKKEETQKASIEDLLNKFNSNRV